MKLIKDHPIILNLGQNLIIGETYTLTGIQYEVVDYNHEMYELKIINPLIITRKRTTSNISLDM
jgi:hypothetical protein